MPHKKQNHDIVPIGRTDTEILPKKSLKGSHDQESSLVDKEERASLAQLIESADFDASKVLIPSNVEVIGAHIPSFLGESIMNGVYLGSPADRVDIIKLLHEISASKSTMNREDLSVHTQQKAEALHDAYIVAANEYVQSFQNAYNEFMSSIEAIDMSKSEKAKAAQLFKEANDALKFDVIARDSRDPNTYHFASTTPIEKAKLAQQHADEADARIEAYQRKAVLAYHKANKAFFYHQHALQGAQDAGTTAYYSRLNGQQISQMLEELKLTSGNFIPDISLKFEKQEKSEYAFRDKVQHIQKTIGNAAKTASSDNPVKLLNGLTEMQTEFFFHMVNLPNLATYDVILFENSEADRRWVTLWYIVFREFCLKNPEICSNGDPESPIQQIIVRQTAKRQKLH
ncbi:uncharacterized protein PHALS_03528 [Plasmopara halstedii]|uniref:Uncharacterized protein n=1 Tax=Plasmopara halstedii TaxID=4781 RepID=A0A0P1B0L7_PLAHL|nr:uncharacterized protein PHALS_03528 [Plasmopara halstedii]CEG46852.1 hypothetical protein PHALS_03528 [Plasmopara halstedii]|eukprot:XP_024583221.1 hypothetical protein PHALS_03528 [Plasmopara halstedii]